MCKSQWGLTQLTHNWTMCRKWEILEHLVLNGLSSLNLLFWVQGLMWKRRRKDSKRQRAWMTPDSALSFNRANAQMNSQTWWSPYMNSTGSSQKGSALRQGNGHGLQSLTKRLSVIGSTLQRENLSLPTVSLSTFTTHLRLCSCPGVDG